MEDNTIITGLIGLALGTIIGLIIGLYSKKTRLRDYHVGGLIKEIQPLHPVYPSTEESVFAIAPTGQDQYNGAHHYLIKKSLGYNETINNNVYLDDVIELEFVQKQGDGQVSPGIQNEQLVIVLIDRIKKLDKAFPSVYNKQMINNLIVFLHAAQDRIADRQKRNVMGKLKE